MILREERIRQGVSLTRIAEMAGLSRQMVGYVERGLRVPTIDTLLRICGALQIDAVSALRRAQRRQ